MTKTAERYKFQGGAIDWSVITKEMSALGIREGQVWEDKRPQPRNYGPSFKRRLLIKGAGWSHSREIPQVVCSVTNRTKWGYPEARFQLDRFKKSCVLVRDVEA